MLLPREAELEALWHRFEAESHRLSVKRSEVNQQFCPDPSSDLCDLCGMVAMRCAGFTSCVYVHVYACLCVWANCHQQRGNACTG